MTSIAYRTYSLALKDLVLEFRSKESIMLMLGLGLLESVFIAAALHTAFLDADQIRRLFPVFIWIVFLFSATLASGRQLDHDLEFGALEALRLAGVTGPALFLSKAASLFVICMLAHIAASGALALLCDVPLWRFFLGFLGCSALVLFGYSCLATLLGALTASARLKSFLFPLLFLPLLFPLFFGALEFTGRLVATGSIELDSPWLSLLICCDVLYLLLGINLFEFAIHD